MPASICSTAEPDDTIKVAAEAVMREIIGRTPIQTA